MVRASGLPAFEKDLASFAAHMGYGRVTRARACLLLVRHAGLRAVLLLRLSQWCDERGIPGFPTLLSNLNLMVHGIDVSPSVDIGAGLYVPHPVGVVIQATAVGEDVTIQSCVTVGLRADAEFPTIADRAWISTGAKVLGSVRVGVEARIGANAVVLQDVPDGCTAVGVPARVIRPDQAKQD